MSRTSTTRWLRRGLAALAALFLAIQLVPYGRDHDNPPVTGEPSWDSPRTEDLARRACFDCHSNETRWPWYTHVAPASWLVGRDVAEGREHLNFSEFDRARGEAGEAAEEFEEGEMPPWFYVPLHAEARLSPEEAEALAAGLRATFGDDRDHDAARRAR